MDESTREGLLRWKYIDSCFVKERIKKQRKSFFLRVKSLKSFMLGVVRVWSQGKYLRDGWSLSFEVNTLKDWWGCKWKPFISLFVVQNDDFFAAKERFFLIRNPNCHQTYGSFYLKLGWVIGLSIKKPILNVFSTLFYLWKYIIQKTCMPFKYFCSCFSLFFF